MRLSPLQRNLAALRKRAKLSQAELAAEAGVDKTAISQWERGRSSPRADRLIRIARALGVSVGALYRDRGDA